MWIEQADEVGRLTVILGTSCHDCGLLPSFINGRYRQRFKKTNGGGFKAKGGKLTSDLFLLMNPVDLKIETKLRHCGGASHFFSGVSTSACAKSRANDPPLCRVENPSPSNKRR
jgi:hypothetical protein